MGARRMSEMRTRLEKRAISPQRQGSNAEDQLCKPRTLHKKLFQKNVKLNELVAISYE